MTPVPPPDQSDSDVQPGLPADGGELGAKLSAFTPQCLCLDLEVHPVDRRILKIGAVRPDLPKTLSVSGRFSLEKALAELDQLAEGAAFLLGHNIVRHDLEVLRAVKPGLKLFGLPAIDTLDLSPIAFPKNPYHRLVKNYKLVRDSANDPVADAELTLSLLRDQRDALASLFETNPGLVETYFYLLTPEKSGSGLKSFFMQVTRRARPGLDRVRSVLEPILTGRVCGTRLRSFLKTDLADAALGQAIAYSVAWITVAGGNSVLPPWVRHQYPEVRRLIQEFRDVPCGDPNCAYCAYIHDSRKQLERFFGFADFRPVPKDPSGAPLQRQIVEAGLRGESFVAILPTGAGKSLCYQLPALVRYWRNGSLTLVVSPLQALMKDQVDNLVARGTVSAATLNGLLTIPERRDVLEKLRLGDVSILLISPEQFRNRTFREAIKHREISAVVFDEAHCLSKWGHDFRTDYLYVGRFIKEHIAPVPPICCFTATAKEDVVEDIQGHFRDSLGLDLSVFAGGHDRENLHFAVVPVQSSSKLPEIHEYLKERLAENVPGGAIVYAATRNSAEEISDYLSKQGWACAHFHGGMTPERKKQVQSGFIRGQVKVIAATNAFGMGIDKPDVRLVLHAAIPGSLENYLQEAGRAGRDQSEAECVLFYDEKDVEQQFQLAASSRLTQKDIAAILRKLRRAKKDREGNVVITSGEILADDEISVSFDREDRNADTRVRTAVAWIERAGLVERNENRTNVFPASLKVPSTKEVVRHLSRFNLPPKRLEALAAIVEAIINAEPTDGISTDELSLTSGLPSDEVFKALQSLEEMGILENDLRITVFLSRGTANHSAKVFDRVHGLESALLDTLRVEAPDADKNEGQVLNLRHLTQRLKDAGYPDLLPDEVLRVLGSLKHDVKAQGEPVGSIDFKHVGGDRYVVYLQRGWATLQHVSEMRRQAAKRILDTLLEKLPNDARGADLLVEAKASELVAAVKNDLDLRARLKDPAAAVQRALLYLHEQGVMTLNRGLSVFRAAMTIRVAEDAKGRKFTKADYEPLELHYKERMFQVHVMQEYARLAQRKISDAINFVAAYFHLPRKELLKKYFHGRREVLELATTEESYQRIVDALNQPIQRGIVAAKADGNRLILAGPGSGKTKVIVHRAAYLQRVLREPPQSILVLTFNRYAAKEVRRRLFELIDRDAFGVTVLTYHALAMRLTGTSLAARSGDAPPDFEALLDQAIALLQGQSEIADTEDELRDRILRGYRYILVDEYQDIDAKQYELVSAIAGRTAKDPDQKLTILAVGDDDQNIYSFRGANVEFIKRFQADYDANLDYLIENYRSTRNIIDASNAVIARNAQRMKTAHPIRVNAKRGRDPAGGEWEAIDSGVGRGRVQILPSGTGPYSQAVLAVDELQRLSRLDEGWDWTKCAVLARNREFLHPVRALCVERGIPVHWQEAGDKAPPFHHIREVAAFLDVLKAVRRDIANAATILNKFDELHRAPAGNPWAESLQECLKGYLEDTNNQALPIEDCIEWIYEYGAERRRDTFTGLWLNTAHAAKGCEFDHVVVLDAGWVRQSNEVDSERRLYYVAMTRTRRTLTLCRMSGSATPFPTEALNSSGAFEREAPVAPTVPDSIRREFLTLGLGDVDLGYAGRTADDRIHAAIRALRPGDSLQLVASQGTQQLRNAKGVTIGRLAKNFRLPDKKVHAVTVSSIVRRTRDQVTDPKWLPAIKVDVWEVVVPEIVVG